MKKSIAQFGSACLVGFILSMPAYAGKTASHKPVKATFDDTGAIISDGQGAYLDGVNGISSYVDSNGSYFLNIPLGSARSMYADLNNPVDPLNAPVSGVLQCGGARQSWLWVKFGMNSIPIGGTALLAAEFNMDLDSSGNQLRSRWGTASGYPSDAPALAVTRTSATTYTVETSTQGDQSEVQKVTKKGAYLFEADYHLPVRLFLELQ